MTQTIFTFMYVTKLIAVGKTETENKKNIKAKTAS